MDKDFNQILEKTKKELDIITEKVIMLDKCFIKLTKTLKDTSRYLDLSDDEINGIKLAIKEMLKKQFNHKN